MRKRTFFQSLKIYHFLVMNPQMNRDTEVFLIQLIMSILLVFVFLFYSWYGLSRPSYPKPEDCDWFYAPVGEKGCHYTIESISDTFIWSKKSNQ